MKRIFSSAMGTLAIVLAAACGASDTPETPQTGATALSIPGKTPVPINPDTGKPSWNGSPVELMFADALATCSYAPYPVDMPIPPEFQVDFKQDTYARYIQTQMNTATCRYVRQGGTVVDYGLDPANPEAQWLDQRNDKNCNIDPSTRANASVPLARSLPTIDVPVEAPFEGYGVNITRWATARTLKSPITNLCIAQTLRSRAPGASGGEALLLSAADQRQLLALQKDRAQMAMLQFALIGQTFATLAVSNPGNISNIYTPTDPQNGDPYSYLPMLQQWAQGASGDRLALLRTMGDEFAAAVQIHVTASRELAELLMRSGSAHLPRGASGSGVATINAGQNASAVEVWGAGSWRQRAMASLFGGDPLVEDPLGNTPWRHFAHNTSPGAWAESVISWPSTEMPFASTELKDPKAQQLLTLAENADALFLQKSDTLIPDESKVTIENPYRCHEVLRSPSAKRLYRATEAYVRTNQCSSFEPSTTTCRTFTTSDIPDPANGYSDFELWQKYRITPSHAEELVALLDEGIPKDCVKHTLFRNMWGTPLFEIAAAPKRAPVDVGGQISNVTMDGLPQYHITSFQPKARVLRETAGLYSRYAAFAIPREIYPQARPASQGFFLVRTANVGDEACEQMRRMGAIPALTATRDALITSARLLASSAQPVKAFFERSQAILRTIEGGIGRSSISITPGIGAPGARSASGDASGWTFYNYSTVHPIEYSDTRMIQPWRVEVATDVEDPFWNAPDDTEYRLFAIPDNSVATSLAMQPGSTIFGRGIEESLLAAGVVESVLSSAPSAPANTVKSNFRRFELRLPGSTAEWSFVVRRKAQATGESPTYQPIADHLYVQHEKAAKYAAFNGSLSNFAARVIAIDPNQPARPAFDGFGLPAAWLPPSDPALFGGTAGDDAVSAYLRKARASAEEATVAVKEAFEEMLKQQQDEAQLAAAVAKGEKVAALERSALCGSAHCDTSMTEVTLDIPSMWNAASPRMTWFRVAETIKETDAPRPIFSDLQNKICVVPPGSTWDKQFLLFTPKQRLDCLASFILTTAQRPFKVLTPVANQRSAPAAPDFSEYAGGTLQAVAIEQWAALRTLEDRVRSLIATTDAGIGHVDLLENELDRSKEQNKEMYNRCGRLDDEMLHEALRECVDAARRAPTPTAPYQCKPELLTRGWDELTWADEVSKTKSESGGFGLSAYFVSGNVSTGSSSSPMSLAGKRRLCEAYRDKLDSSAWRLTEGVLQAYSNVEERRNEFTQATARIQSAAASAASLRHQTDLAIAKNDLEVELLRASQKSSFGLYRQLHSYDAWRAKALLDSARLSAAIARKAIESRYVVNLSSLTSPEPLVASPASWADEVYEYDLDMPAAVGLTVGDPAPGGIYPNRVVDYVGNLERFVNGYSIARPTTVASGDTEIISLPGPRGRVDGSPPAQTIYPDGSAYAWSFYCAAGTGGTWRTMPPSGRPSDACLPGVARPSRARLIFALDSWGRLHGDIADEPFDKRYNARWKDLAVNLVGTGILACDKARDPLGCQSQPFVRYRLSQTGTPWITDADQSWSILPVPTGRIEGAKALAAELWFDPIENSWSKPFVAAVARGEFGSRPFGGAYEIEFEVSPEVVLERIDRVQILASSNYWIKQQ